MTLVVRQLFPESLGVSLMDPTADHIWQATGSEDTSLVLAALDANIPQDYRGLYLQNYFPDHKGAGLWDVRVHYGRERPRYPDILKFKCSSTGSTIHREHSLETVARYADPAVFTLPRRLPDYKGLIGVSTEGIAGVDVVEPHGQITLSKRFDARFLATDFIEKVQLAVGKNESPVVIMWKGQIITYPVGSLLYKGANISDGGRGPDANDLIDLDYDLEFSKPMKGVTIGNLQYLDGSASPPSVVGEIEKDGWDYIWFVRRKTVSNDSILHEPIAALIERVYFPIDFNQLGF